MRKAGVEVQGPMTFQLMHEGVAGGIGGRAGVEPRTRRQIVMTLTFLSAATRLTSPGSLVMTVTFVAEAA